MSSLHPPRRRVLAAACAAPLVLAARVARAHAPPTHNRLVDVAVIDRQTGERLPVLWHGGRRYVAGTPGHRYAIELANRTGARVLAVVAVDGVNAVTGETAAWNQSGYVFAPWQRWEVRGWRKSASRVAAFEFTRLSDSYAARTGRPHDVGVIGVALFRERPPAYSAPLSSAPARVERSDADRSELDSAQSARESVANAPAANPARDSSAAPRGLSAPNTSSGSTAASGPLEQRRADERLGTGHGASETSRVIDTAFQRASVTPHEVIEIRYDSRENLLAAGVITPSQSEALPPRPFPMSGSYVPDPPR